MKINRLLLLFGAVFFLSVPNLEAQNIQYSKDQIVGKWILKSASYNGLEVSLQGLKERISFEFSQDGKVIYVASDGSQERGDFLLKENKIVDPKVPEYPDADIVALSKEGLVLEMKEAEDRVRMTFELVD